MGGGTPALNQPSTGMTPGGNSLLNSVMGGGGSVPGAAGGMPMGGFAGLAGMGGMGNSIAGRMPPKPATPPRELRQTPSTGLRHHNNNT